MRYLLTTVALAFMSTYSYAQQYFKDGTKWKTELSGINSDGNGPHITSSNSYVWLDGEETVDGYQAMKMYCSEENKSEKNLYAYIRTEGDKVFFLPAGIDGASWYLMYDFGLKVGDECYVYDASNFDYYPSMHPSYIKCVGIEENAENGITSIIVQKRYEDGERVNETFVWYKGLSSELGVIYNNTIDMVGIDTRLTEVTCDGKVVFKNKTTGIEATKVGKVKVTVNGLDVSVANIEKPCQIALFSFDGRLLNRIVAKTNTANLTLPGYGIYILQVGGHIQKVVAK